MTRVIIPLVSDDWVMRWMYIAKLSYWTDKPLRDPSSPELRGRNAGPTGAVLMIDANQVWDIDEAIEYVKALEEIRPW